MNANWTIAILLLVAAALVTYMFFEPVYPGQNRPQMVSKKVVLPYRPSATMGTNDVAPSDMDIKALCATTDVCV